MATYQRKRDPIEAVQFTEEHAKQLDEVPHLPPPLQRVQKNDQGGFTLGEQRVAFGDYIVAEPKGHTRVVSGPVFEAEFELREQVARLYPEKLAGDSAVDPEQRRQREIAATAIDSIAEKAGSDRITVIDMLPGMAGEVGAIVRRRLKSASKPKPPAETPKSHAEQGNRPETPHEALPLNPPPAQSDMPESESNGNDLSRATTDITPPENS